MRVSTWTNILLFMSDLTVEKLKDIKSKVFIQVVFISHLNCNYYRRVLKNKIKAPYVGPPKSKKFPTGIWVSIVIPNTSH